MAGNIYLWETVSVAQGARDTGPGPAKIEYQRRIAEGWAPKAGERGLSLVATWSIAFGPSPWCVNLWEFAGWNGVAQMLDAQYNAREQQAIDIDAKLADWFASTNRIRSYVEARLAAPSARTPALAALLKDRISGTVYRQERVWTTAFRAAEYQQRVDEQWRPLAERHGAQLIGCYKAELRDDSEVISIWALRDYAHWAQFELGLREDRDVRRWIGALDGLVARAETWLLNPYPSSPLQQGRLA
jgi:hypothetical protein